MKNIKHYRNWPERLPKTLTVPETTLYENLLFTTKKYPNNIAIHYYGRSYTYRDIFKEIEHLAGFLEKKLGVTPGEKILLYMQNSPQYIIGFFAILRARGVVVPINPMSTTRDLEFFINDCEIQYALTGQELADNLLPLKGKTKLKEIIVAAYSDYINPEAALGELPEEVLLPREKIAGCIPWTAAMEKQLLPGEYTGKGEDMALLPYTSGTTGLPKGCIHTHKTVQTNVHGSFHWFDYTSDSVVLAALPLFHVTGLVHSMLVPIMAGGTMVLLTRWNRDYAAKAIEQFRCSHWINISTMLIDFLSNPKLANYDVSSLQLIGGGGAPLPEAVGEKLFKMTDCGMWKDMD